MSKAKKINVLIVGPGRLGSQLAFHALKLHRIATLFLVGREVLKTRGLVADLQEAFPNQKIVALDNYKVPEPVTFTFFTFSTLQWTPAIGVNDRFVEAIENIRVVDEISRNGNTKKYGTIFVVSNPVDILTKYVSIKFNSSDVFGFGISLDEARVAATVGRDLNIRTDRVPCIGEHGVHLVPLLSQVLGGLANSRDVYERILQNTFDHTEIIIRNSGIPYFAPLRELERLLEILFLCKSETITLSKYFRSPILGVEDISLGVPIHIEQGENFKMGRLKAGSIIEERLFQESAEAVKAAYARISDVERLRREVG